MEEEEEELQDKKANSSEHDGHSTSNGIYFCPVDILYSSGSYCLCSESCCIYLPMIEENNSHLLSFYNMLPNFEFRYS